VLRVIEGIVIKSFNHVGLSVVSLEKSVSFYRDVLGMEVIVETTFEGERYSAILGLKEATGRVAFLKSGSTQLELFEFSNPKPASGSPERPVCDHGITHFCIEVIDVDRAYEQLSRAGVAFHCPPLAFSEGTKATYARDPDGNVFELLEEREPG
jgi:catechol 2,3-dioxygenase-like lactoylglutathione lyase family enzyme